MIDLQKYTDLSGKLPVVGVTPEELVGILWHSVPGIVTGVVVASVLIWLRGMIVGLADSRARWKLPDGLVWVAGALRFVGVWYLMVVGISIAVAAAPVSNELKHVVAQGYGLLSIIQIALVLMGVFREGTRTYVAHHKPDGSRVLLINAISTVGTLLIWALAGIAALNTVGVNVTALLAGLGLGGVAIAFATKNIFENMLASFSMVINPPFVIGDFISGGEILGTVVEINLKYVVVRQLSGEMLTVPSSDVLNMKIHNWSRMMERRIEFNFGVGYTTMNAEKLKRVPQIMREAIEAQGDKVRFDRAHFAGFGDLMMNFVGVYIVKSPDYNTYMDVNQAILLRIYEELEKAGVELALGSRAGNAADLMGMREMGGVRVKKKLESKAV